MESEPRIRMVRSERSGVIYVREWGTGNGGWYVGFFHDLMKGCLGACLTTPKALRAACFLPLAFVGSILIPRPRDGDARVSPPRPEPKFHAAGPVGVFRQALRKVFHVVKEPVEWSPCGC